VLWKFAIVNNHDVIRVTKAGTYRHIFRENFCPWKDDVSRGFDTRIVSTLKCWSLITDCLLLLAPAAAADTDAHAAMISEST